MYQPSSAGRRQCTAELLLGIFLGLINTCGNRNGLLTKICNYSDKAFRVAPDADFLGKKPPPLHRTMGSNIPTMGSNIAMFDSIEGPTLTRSNFHIKIFFVKEININHDHHLTDYAFNLKSYGSGKAGLLSLKSAN